LRLHNFIKLFLQLAIMVIADDVNCNFFLDIFFQTLDLGGVQTHNSLYEVLCLNFSLGIANRLILESLSL
jgi:hypothetical protein